MVCYFGLTELLPQKREHLVVDVQGMVAASRRVVRIPVKPAKLQLGMCQDGVTPLPSGTEKTTGRE